MALSSASSSLTSLSRTPKVSLPTTTTTTKYTKLTTTRVIFNLLPNKSNFNLTSISKRHRFPLSTSRKSLVNPNPNFQNSTTKCLFTGIVEEMGEVKHIGPTKDGGVDLRIGAKTVLDGVKLGDSISINGTCLTVTNFTDNEFTVGLAPETLRKTSLIELKIGALVNLERAVQPTSRMGGHFVQGHVDCTGEIVEKVVEGDSLWIKVKVENGLLKYIVPKGFIAVDGTSLTVVDVFDNERCFNFMLVAYTQRNVVIPLKNVGDKVNLEVDILGKYVERLLNSGFVESINVS